MSSDTKPTKKDRKEQKKQILKELAELTSVDNAVEKFNKDYHALKLAIVSNGLKGNARRILLIALLLKYNATLKECNEEAKTIKKELKDNRNALSIAFKKNTTDQINLAASVNTNLCNCDENTIKSLAYEYIISKIQNKL